jgi:predicted P-loop ATPase
VSDDHTSTDDIAARFLALFAGLDRSHGIYRIPAAAKPNGKGKLHDKSWARTVEEPLTVAVWAGHLRGDYGLGVVPVRDDGTCVFGAIDVDVYPLDHAKLAADIARHALPLVMCRTKSVGAHLYAFFSEPVQAALAIEKLKGWARLLGCLPKVEIFPKQSALYGASDHGSWINMPYQGGKRSTRYAFKPDGASSYTPEEFLEHVETKKISAAALADWNVVEDQQPEPTKKEERKKPRGFMAEVTAAALADIAAWAPALVPGGYWSGRAYRVTSKTLSRDLEEDLSFHPEGVKDFGTGRSYTPIEAMVEFGGADGVYDAAVKLAKLLDVAVPEFVRDAKGDVVANSQHNIRNALEKMHVTASHDVFQDRMLIQGLPECGPLLDDRAMERLWLLMDERFAFRASREFFWTVVADLARRNAFHPVRDYLGALRWDGVPRVDAWLATYGGAEDTPFVRAIGALVLVAACKRIAGPGCKFDEMLVLESEQGTNKSSALQVLAVDDDWFSDDCPLNAEGKRVIEALAGRWIVEAAELKGMRKGEVEHLKAFTARRVDRARMSYDRLVTEVPRQCVIVGTTNSEKYLRDSTGNRRFWPVRVKGFDLDALRRDRDQLWAEATHRAANGESVRLDPALYGAASEEQGARMIEDPYTDLIAEALGDLTGKIKNADVWKLVGKQSGNRTQDDNARLGEAMRVNGWEHVKTRFNGKNGNGNARGTPTERLVHLVVHLQADGSFNAAVPDEEPQ